ncbi:hypothetical protein PoMZ_06729 [Pyricularia oryzae]|uniref:Uncharacterized protein n=1 Tax=Pyricularia oryzae TaxID=318829 RepID=A0A4P7NT18_PYROR|nr:hypothetical protein PoMZ_06729 [Pyricularia oryzae]
MQKVNVQTLSAKFYHFLTWVYATHTKFREGVEAGRLLLRGKFAEHREMRVKRCNAQAVKEPNTPTPQTSSVILVSIRGTQWPEIALHMSETPTTLSVPAIRVIKRQTSDTQLQR